MGVPRNMKSMRMLSAAIFFMTYFYRAGGGGMAPWSPLDPLLKEIVYFTDNPEYAGHYWPLWSYRMEWFVPVADPGFY